jgi:hypothetical protein
MVDDLRHAGRWRVEVSILREGVHEARATFEVAVR